MLIVCPACATEYTLDPDRVGSKGRIVRCARCKTSWFAAAAPLPARPVDTVARPADVLARPVDKAAMPADKTARPVDRPAGAATVIDEAETVAVGRRRPGRIAATRAKAKTPFRITGGLATATLLATVAIAASAVAFRVPLVKAAPGSARLFAAAGLPVNVLGLAIEDVTSAFDEENGRRVLVTEGTVANVARADQQVPDLDVTVFGADNDTLYQWSAKPPAGEIAAGDRKRFSIRLASPPPAGTHVVVTFVAPLRGAAVASR